CAGEIVGLAGLVGSGRTELARAIFGADAVTRGEVLMAGQIFKGGPVAGVRRGMAFVPENRKAEGLALIRSVHDNLLSAGLTRLFPNRLYRFGRAGKTVDGLIQRLRVATPSPRRLA